MYRVSGVEVVSGGLALSGFQRQSVFHRHIRRIFLRLLAVHSRIVSVYTNTQLLLNTAIQSRFTSNHIYFPNTALQPRHTHPTQHQTRDKGNTMKALNTERAALRIMANTLPQGHPDCLAHHFDSTRILRPNTSQCSAV
jgi:hypothetical protein